jgi:hypothetical protein
MATVEVRLPASHISQDTFQRTKAFSATLPVLLQLNPQHTIPTIDDNGLGIGER